MAMDHIIQEATKTSQWTISVGRNFIHSTIIICQFFIIAEIIAYFILFHDFYTHNESLKIKKPLLISINTLNKRKRRNVVTLFGQFISFLIESTCAIIIHISEMYLSSNTFSIVFPPFGIVFFAFLTFTFFMASPELKRFYFSKKT